MKQKSLEKRLASERRREVRKVKSREAARCRRGKEFEVFADLTDSLPVPEANKMTFDKASIIRLSINYMKCRDFFRNICEISPPIPGVMDSFLHDLVEGMQCFIMILSPNSEIIYVTENIKLLLGLCQYDVIGNRLLEFTHPCDIKDVEDQVSSDSNTCSFIARFKTTLLPKGRVVNLKSASYKAVKFTGQRLVADTTCDTKKEVVESAQPLSECLVVTGMPLSQPSGSEEPMDCMTFASSHSLDMKFTDCDTQLTDLLKYPGETILGVSLYDIVHSSDIKQVEKDFKTLYSKGHMVTEPYKVLAYGGGFAQVITQASLVYSQKTSRPHRIVCVNYLLNSIQQPDLIMARIQTPEHAANDSGVSVKEKIEERSYCMLLDDLSDKSTKDIITLTASMFDQGCDVNAFSDDDVFNTTAKTFLSEKGPESVQNDTAAVFVSAESDTVDITAGLFSEEPAISKPKPDLDGFVEKLDGDLPDLHSGLMVDTSGLEEEFDSEFFLRAPYIPMDTHDDVNLIESCSPVKGQPQEPQENFPDYRSMMDIKSQPIQPLPPAIGSDYLGNESLYSSSTGSAAGSPHYQPTSYKDSEQGHVSPPGPQAGYTDYQSHQPPNQLLLPRHMKGISASVFGASALEPDKLSALMADMACLTSRVPEAPRGEGAPPRYKTNSSPTLMSNSTKRKRHAISEAGVAITSLAGSFTNLDGQKFSKKAKPDDTLLDSGQLKFYGHSGLLSSRQMVDQNFLHDGVTESGRSSLPCQQSPPRMAGGGTGSVMPNVTYSGGTGDTAADSYGQFLLQLLPDNYDLMSNSISKGGGASNLLGYSPVIAASAKTRERTQVVPSSTNEATGRTGDLLLPLLMD